MNSPVIAITGANGFVGRHLCRFLSSRGYIVRALVRNPPSMTSLSALATGGVYRCNLPDDIDPGAFNDKIDVLIDCAYDTRSCDRLAAGAAAIQTTQRLLELVRTRGIERLVFLSSLSAHADALSTYGQSKYQSEQLLDPSRDLAVRPGLVIGNGGLFVRIKAIARKSPVIPMPYGGNKVVQTVGVDDLCAAIECALERGMSGLIRVAEPEGVCLKNLYRAIARLEGRRPLLLPIPGEPVRVLVGILERLGLPTPFTTDNLLGLKQMKHVDVADDIAQLGIPIRPFEASLRALAQDGQALL